MKKPVMLDTQLLVLLVVGATDWRIIDRHKRTKDDYTRSDFHLLLDMLGSDPRFVFCPHVATETSNLLKQHNESDRSRIMSVLKALLNNGTELGIPSRRAMEDPDFVRLGLADAVQLALCADDAVLLTDDEPLFHVASARGLATVHFSEERLLRNQDPD